MLNPVTAWKTTTAEVRGPRWDSHEISGLTARLILAYVERERGRAGVEAVLDACDLGHAEEQLRDETRWRDFHTHMRIFEAAARVLDDPAVARKVGAAAIDLEVLPGLKRALRGLGGTRIVYAQLARLARKFISTHRWELIELGQTRARYSYRDLAGAGYHPADCQYNVGLLSCIPTLFGSLPARVRHTECALDGADACLYEVSWSEEDAVRRLGARVAAMSAVTLVATATARPRRLPPVAGASALAALLVGHRAWQARRQKQASLEAEVRDHKEAAERLIASLEDLSSDLRLEEVLEKIARNAQAAAVGKEFVLLVDGERGLRVQTNTANLPWESVEAVELWAASTPGLLDGPLTMPDLDAVPALGALSAHPRTPLGAAHSAPLRFRGQALGVLVALAHGLDAFLPHETPLLTAYATQAAVALANARMVESLERLASLDPLTELLNQREFTVRVAHELGRARRYGHTVALALFDLDRFKAVNDVRGHAAGDRVLRAVAREIEAVCRASDSAFRLGGDEFGLLLPQSTRAEAESVGRRVRRAVEGLEERVGLSFGVAQWPEDGLAIEQLLEQADRALYRAKGTLGDRVR
jgi:diguanylate cyclase (GGDEF)-like protein